MKSTITGFYAGTSGLVLPVKNKLEYPAAYRDKSRLYYYSTLFNTIEVNSIFYKLPLNKTVQRWNYEVADDFRFTFKLSKEITHCPDLNFEKYSVNRFFEVVDVPQIKRGCILIQFPGKITADFTSKLKKLLSLISKLTVNNPWKLAIEFRHVSWYTQQTIRLLKQYNATCVIHDIKPFTTELLYPSDIIYIRFHGTEKNYRGSYSDELLTAYSVKIKNWLKEGREVFAYFNNTLGPAVQNLITLDNLVRQSPRAHDQEVTRQ